MLACSAGQIISFQVTHFPINEMPYFLQREGKLLELRSRNGNQIIVNCVRLKAIFVELEMFLVVYTHGT